MVNRLNLLVRTCLLIGVLGVAIGCGEADNVDQLEGDTLSTEALPTEEDNARSIYGVLQQDGRFSRFITAVDSAGLEQTLSGPGPFTIFVPADEAFDQRQDVPQVLLSSANRDQLRGLLLYHISSGEQMAADLQDGSSIQTLEGGTLTISGSGDSLQIVGARVTETNIQASNGVVHVIDSVLRPGAGT